eukprot:7535411-Alexandrium_andersonii.AAC.1
MHADSCACIAIWRARLRGPASPRTRSLAQASSGPVGGCASGAAGASEAHAGCRSPAAVQVDLDEAEVE